MLSNSVTEAFLQSLKWPGQKRVHFRDEGLPQYLFDLTWQQFSVYDWINNCYIKDYLLGLLK